MNPAQRREWRRTVFGHEELTPAQRLVLLALESFADWPDGTNARPGVARLAEVCRMDGRSVKRALSRGRELGLIEQTARANPRRGWAATHRLVSQPDSRCPVSPLESGFKVTLGTVQGDKNDVSRGQHSPPTYSDRGNNTESAAAPPLPDPYCPAHMPHGTVDRCGPCGAAGRIRKGEIDRRAENRQAAQAAAAKATEDCPLCDEAGWLRGDDGSVDDRNIRCTHKADE